MHWMESEQRGLKFSIKLNKRACLSQMGLLIFNIAGIFYNVKFGFLFAGGCFASNALWTLCLLVYYFGELKGDKAHLHYIEEIELKEKLEDDKKSYQEAKKRYDDFFTRQAATGLGCNQEGEPRSPGFVCTQADVQNCH